MSKDPYTFTDFFVRLLTCCIQNLCYKITSKTHELLAKFVGCPVPVQVCIEMKRYIIFNSSGSRETCANISRLSYLNKDNQKVIYRLGKL